MVIIEMERLGGSEGELCPGTEWQVGVLLRRRLWGPALQQGSWKRGGQLECGACFLRVAVTGDDVVWSLNRAQ